MGETGCGKTRLCKYMCQLQLNPNEKKKANNMYLVKVHGGTSTEDIIAHVVKAQELAKKNSQKYPGMFTVLFFDEANSTEAIGTIKEIMCDQRINGAHLEQNTGLKIIAACNPYKKHEENTIKNFEKSGLGFYVDTNETQEKLGDLPMRHLVYRVQPLPAAMLPIIWDFGQLSDEVEKLYINQIVNERFRANNYAHNIGLNVDQIDLIVSLLSNSQKFMRSQQNECSFVSLRDVQRVLALIQWFLKNGQTIFKQMSQLKNADNIKQSYNYDSNDEEDDEELDDQDYEEDEDGMSSKTAYLSAEDQASTQDCESTHDDEMDIAELNLIRAIILSLNTCYHVGLQSEESRLEYRHSICEYFNNTSVTERFIANEINLCYEVFLDEIHLPNAIARNQVTFKLKTLFKYS